MAAKRILLADGSGLSAFLWRGGRVKSESRFSNEPAGIEAFSNYLKKHRSSLYYVLADVSEEGYQIEDLPFVQGGDRSALLKRRLSQYFYNTPLSLSLSLGRSKDGRRDEKLLFAALTRPDSFAPWLDALRAAQVILVGVYSVPLVLANMPSLISSADGPVLLLTVSQGGVRQTFFDKGKLHFSRLTQLATRSIDEIGRVYANESAKIFQYLVAQRQLPRGAPLRTVVLAGTSDFETLQDYCRSSTDLHFEFSDLASAATALKLKEKLRDGSADPLIIHALATRTPDQQFASAAETRFHRLWKVQTGLNGAALVVLAACLMFAGKTGLQVVEMREQTDVLRSAETDDKRRYDETLASLPKVNLSPDELRTLIGRIEALQKRLPPMEALLVQLSRALDEHPRVELSRLNWRMTDNPNASIGATPAAQAAPTGQPGGTWTVVEIDATLPLVLVSDQRAQLDSIEKFASSLRNPQTEVRILSRPFDIEPDKPLRSASDTRGSTDDVPKFTLRIARRL